jgi:hypothetical protein
MSIRDEVLREAEVIKYEGGEIPEVFSGIAIFI